MRHLLTILTVLTIALPVNAREATEQERDNERLCDGRALMAKASAEAHIRGQSLADWTADLVMMKQVVPPENLMARVALQGASDAIVIYRERQEPFQVYIAYYRACMDDHGYMFSLK